MDNYQKQDQTNDNFSQTVKQLWSSRYPDSDPSAVPIFALGHTLSILLEQFHTRSFRSLDHTHPTFAILAMLSTIPQEQQITPAKLGEFIGQTSGGMNKTLKRLEDKSFIERQSNPNDKRSVNISLTEEGTREADRVCPKHAQNELRQLSQLSSEEIQQIESSLQLLIKVLSD